MSQHPEGRWLELGMPQHAEGVGGGWAQEAELHGE